MTNQVIKNAISTAASNTLTSQAGELIKGLSGSPKALLIFGAMFFAYEAVTYCVDSGCGIDIDFDCAGMHTGVKIHHEGKEGQ